MPILGRGVGLQGGKFQGVEILPKEWLEYSLTPTPGSNVPGGGTYGAGWWIKGFPSALQILKQPKKTMCFIMGYMSACDIPVSCGVSGQHSPEEFRLFYLNLAVPSPLIIGFCTFAP